MTDTHDILSWASLCFVGVLITFCSYFYFSFYLFIYFLLFTFYVYLVSKTSKSFDREKKIPSKSQF